MIIAIFPLLFIKNYNTPKADLLHNFSKDDVYVVRWNWLISFSWCSSIIIHKSVCILGLERFL